LAQHLNKCTSLPFVPWAQNKPRLLVVLPVVRVAFSHPAMGTKSREVIYGSRISGAKIPR